MRELVQLSSTVAVPERTAELAMRNPGVRRVLDMGIKVIQYLDKRDEVLTGTVAVREVHDFVVSCDGMRRMRQDYPGEFI